METNYVFCEDPGVLGIFSIIKIAVDVIKIAAPIILIIFSMLEIVKVVASSDVDMKKALQSITRKIMAAVLIFLIPSIINLSVSIVSSNSAFEKTSCWINATSENIEMLKQKKAANAAANSQKIPNYVTVDQVRKGGGGSFNPSSGGGRSNILADKMIEIASKQVDKKGAEFQRAYGTGTGTAWCNVFTWWVSNEAGIYPSFMSLKTAYTEDQLKYFKSGTDSNVSWQDSKANGGNYTPKKGDYIMFNYKASQGRNVSHIGIVAGVDGDTITYIHGNTGGGGASSSIVKITKIKTTTNSIVGYGLWY